MPGNRVKLNTPEAFSHAIKLKESYEKFQEDLDKVRQSLILVGTPIEELDELMNVTRCPECDGMLVRSMRGSKCYKCGWSRKSGEDESTKPEKSKDRD